MQRTFLTVKEALARLPVHMAEREFRRRLRAQGLCYKHGHQLSLTEDHLTLFIQSLECPPAEPSTGRMTHHRRAAEAMRRARQLLE